MRRVGKYELLEEVGHGGMATVFRARDTILERTVALKVLHPHLQKTDEARGRFAREARSIARLEHDAIVRVFDYSDSGAEESYLAVEFLTGPTLKAWVDKHGAMLPEIAARLCATIADALSAAHAQGIVHRDVKPENILIHEQREVKLTDFGIAQMVDQVSFTTTGQVLGSPAHMAPEQIESGTVDARSDVFSLGIVLYYLVTARLPFTGRNAHQILRQIVEGEWPDPLRFDARVGAQMRALLKKAMARDADERFQTAGEFRDAMLAFADGLPVSAVQRYFADPQETVSFESGLLERLLQRGATAASAGQRAEAVGYFQRVLAYDEGNATALAGVSPRAREKGRQHLVWFAVVATASAAVAVFALPSRTERLESPTRRDLELVESPLVDSDVGDSAFDSHVVDSHVVDSRAEAPREVRERSSSNSHVNSTIPADERSGRLIEFRPFPQNVSISIDEAPPRPFGPDFRRVTLAVGSHRIRAIPATSCCEEWSSDVVVLPGGAAQLVDIRLVLRPARLYVTGDPADVRVMGETASEGRTRQLIAVTLAGLEESREVVVAEGTSSEFRARVVLRCGVLTELQVPAAP